MMRIFTLNINGLRGLEKMGYVLPEEEFETNLRCLKELIDESINDTESIIILQEVPHKIWDRIYRTWHENAFYERFISYFEENDYRVFRPKHLIDSWQCIVALSKKDSLWKYIDREIISYEKGYPYGNRMVELQYGDLTLLGLHMKPNDEMWNMIFNSYKERKHTILAGDFNAYECRGEMRDKPQQLRGCQYITLIPCNVITDFRDKSSIDNFFISSAYEITNGIDIKVAKLEKFKTDHALCMFEIK